MRHPQPGSDSERRRFAELQQRLEPLYRWGSIGALHGHGKPGLVCIGADRGRARRLYDRTVEIFDRKGSGRARRGRPRHRKPPKLPA